MITPISDRKYGYSLAHTVSRPRSNSLSDRVLWHPGHDRGLTGYGKILMVDSGYRDSEPQRYSLVVRRERRWVKNGYHLLASGPWGNRSSDIISTHLHPRTTNLRNPRGQSLPYFSREMSQHYPEWVPEWIWVWDDARYRHIVSADSLM